MVLLFKEQKYEMNYPLSLSVKGEIHIMHPYYAFNLTVKHFIVVNDRGRLDLKKKKKKFFIRQSFDFKCKLLISRVNNNISRQRLKH